jgi:proline dehydrogenase
MSAIAQCRVKDAAVLSRTLMFISSDPRVEKLITSGSLARPVVERFVAGYTLEDAVRAIKDLNAKGIGGILDLLGEGVDDPAGAAEASDHYLASIKRIEETGIDTTVSLKPSQLGIAFDKGACIDYVRRLAAEAQAIGTTIEIDMEQSDYVSDTLDVYRLLHSDFPTLRVAVQAYLRRTPVDLQGMAGLKPRVRLIKGAYAETRSIAMKKRAEIDAQFAFLTDWLFVNGADPGIATHDEKLLHHAIAIAGRLGKGPEDFEFQMLFGIRRDLQERLAHEGFRVRCYVPFGTAWYPYLTRRIAERPANLQFFLRALIGS